VYVRPEWLRDGVLTIPKRGKLNFLEIMEAEKAKAQLDDYVSRLTHICNQLGDEATKDSIEEALKATKDIATSNITSASIAESQKAAKKHQKAGGGFFDLMLAYLNEKKFSFMQDKGIRVLARCMVRYERFVREIEKERDFTWDIDHTSREDIEDFFSYVENEKQLSEDYPNIFAGVSKFYPAGFEIKRKQPQIGERGSNSINKEKKLLKGFWSWLNVKEYTDNQPFRGFDMGREVYGTPFYLTLDERNIIADYDLSDSPKLAELRDIFIFQCLIGCRVSDLLAMTKDNLVDGVIQYVPRKTADRKPVVVRVPLNRRAQAILERYKSCKGAKLLPFVNSSMYNKAIKEILTKCNITRMVTVRNSLNGGQEQRAINAIASSHMARRTFVGNLYKKVQDPNLIGKLSGHSEGSKAFVRYRDIDEDLMKETVSLID
jgi:integrase